MPEFHAPLYAMTRSRVAGRGCPRPALSEPCVGLSVHTAQAFTKAPCDTRRHSYRHRLHSTRLQPAGSKKRNHSKRSSFWVRGFSGTSGDGRWQQLSLQKRHATCKFASCDFFHSATQYVKRTSWRTFFRFPTARPNYLSNLLPVSH